VCYLSIIPCIYLNCFIGLVNSFMKQTEYNLFCAKNDLKSWDLVWFPFCILWVVLKFRQQTNKKVTQISFCVLSSRANRKTNKHNKNNNIYILCKVPLTLLTIQSHNYILGVWLSSYCSYYGHHFLKLLDKQYFKWCGRVLSFCSQLITFGVSDFPVTLKFAHVH